MSKKTYKTFFNITLAILAIIVGLTIYVNWYLPHGSKFSTGEVICYNNERGPCVEDYKEDMRKLNIPNWAKFLRENSDKISLILIILSFFLYAKSKND